MMQKALFAVSLVLFAAVTAGAADPSGMQVQKTMQEVRTTLGIVPTFAKSIPPEALPGLWDETKSLYFSSSTALPPRTKDLITLAVSSQIPCKLCVIWDREALKSVKASSREMNEAMQLASITRHWSTFLNGMNYDEAAFRKEIDQAMQYGQQQKEGASKQAAGTVPSASLPLDSISTPQQAYDDIQKTFGMVPTFLRQYPEAGIVGAWKDMKGLELNPNTAITPKEKELIGVAVASTIPCRYCVYFHTQSARMHGASDQEVREALSIAAIDRQWSTILEGQDLNESQFRRESTQIFHYISSHPMPQQQPKQMGGEAPVPSNDQSTDQTKPMGQTEAGVADSGPTHD